MQPSTAATAIAIQVPGRMRSPSAPMRWSWGRRMTARAGSIIIAHVSFCFPFVALVVGAGTTKLALTLWFDVTAMTEDAVAVIEKIATTMSTRFDSSAGMRPWCLNGSRVTVG